MKKNRPPDLSYRGSRKTASGVRAARVASKLESAASRPDSPARKTVLLAVVGMSPAIVTETVWALSLETPPVIPDEIVVLTTSRGEADIKRDLLTPSPEWNGSTVWQSLRQEILGKSSDSRLSLKPFKIITRHDPERGLALPLEDIRNRTDNAAAAEAILDEVRRITANDDTRLIASIAGGRKTMGALLASALSLLGRRGDRLTHILVNDPFDHPGLHPRFFFPPAHPVQHRLAASEGSGSTVSSAGAKLDLADVPYVPLRSLFADRMGRLPGDFMELVQNASQVVEDLARPVSLWLDRNQWVAFINGCPVGLTGRDAVFFDFLYEQFRAGKPPFASHDQIEKPFKDFLAEWTPHHLEVVLDKGGGEDWRKTPPGSDDFRKRLNSLRTRLQNAGLGQWVNRLLPRRCAVGFIASNVRIVPPEHENSTL